MFNGKIWILSLFTMLFLTACNEQEFYEKEFLEAAVEKTPDIKDFDLPDTLPNATGTSNGPSTNDGTNNGGTNNGGSNNGGSNNTNVCSVGNPTDTQDQFVQNTATNSKVDILWVIDDSGSMSDNQQALANNFDSFIEGFIDEGIDFKMGITTTDPRAGKSGVMVGNADQLTSAAAAADEAQFKANFKRWIKVGTRGSGNEQGLYSSRDFLSNYNSFLRDDAYLVVVYVSDEEDHSSDSVQDYLDFYQSLKASAGMFKAYSIITTAASMPYARSTESIGERYAAISTATSGEIADITQNFHTTLTNFSTSILNLLDSFPLSAEPINADIEITVDGVPVTAGWSYVADNRTIKFDQNAIPDAGEIVIAYYQKCE